MTVFDFVQMHQKLLKQAGKTSKYPNTFPLTTEDGVQLCSPFCEVSS